MVWCGARVYEGFGGAVNKEHYSERSWWCLIGWDCDTAIYISYFGRNMMLAIILSFVAWSMPQQLSQQGRLLDADGFPVQGSHNLSFQIFESPIATTPLWGESSTVFFSNGYFFACPCLMNSRPCYLYYGN